MESNIANKASASNSLIKKEVLLLQYEKLQLSSLYYVLLSLII